jgi:hypothetical protein
MTPFPLMERYAARITVRVHFVRHRQRADVSGAVMLASCLPDTGYLLADKTLAPIISGFD